MRWTPAPPLALAALLVAVLALSGCVADEEEPEDPLVRVCPQWIEGPAEARANATATPDGVRVLLEPSTDGADGSAALAVEHQGFPLDLYVVQVASEGPVVGRAATPDGRNLLMRDAAAAEPDSRPSLGADADAPGSWAVHLTAVAHDADAEPSGLVLNLTADAPTPVEVVAKPWYRVCGAVVDEPRST